MILKKLKGEEQFKTFIDWDKDFKKSLTHFYDKTTW